MNTEDRYKLEIPIRSVFLFGAERLQIMCVPAAGGMCGECVFKDHPYCEVFNCCDDSRADGKEVIFVEIKEVLS